MPNWTDTALVIQCGKSKIWGRNPKAKRVKAKDAYLSNYFCLCRRYAEKAAGKWFILSGKYGLIDPNFTLRGQYDHRLRRSQKFLRKVTVQ
jgi:hypothetical protein